MLWTPKRKTVIAAIWITTSLVLLYKFRQLPADGRLIPTTRPITYQESLYPFSSKWSRRVPTYPVNNYTQLPQGSVVNFPKVQVDTIYETTEARNIRLGRLDTIKQSFKHSWKGYRENAWLSDELLPVTGGKKNSFGGWAATLVDSLDTLWIMGLHEEFDDAVKAVAGIDFESSTADVIHVFETTIRYLGGLLSAYQLSNQEVLLDKALSLGHVLYAAFDTPSRLPVPYWHWKLALQGVDQDTINREISAEVGSLCMEFTKLSQLSGDMRFYDAVNRITELLAAQQSMSQIPGLWPVFVNTQMQDFASGDEFSLGAMADSLYEYLPKMHIMLGGLQPLYGDMYNKALEASKKHLFFRPITPDNRDILLSGVVRGDEGVDGSEQHLVCFVGGMVGMGAKLFNNNHDLDTARRLANGCYWAYESMKSGIMPETFTAIPCDGAVDCEWNETRWHSAVKDKAGLSSMEAVEQYVIEKHLPPGFASITDGRYILRPEALESIFYMYRITGEPEWQEKAWKMFLSINHATQAEFGYSAVENVAADTLKQVDSMESFWTAETLKYLYLIFSDINVISLDEWVFNTEAHPFKRALPEKSWWSWW